MSDVRTSPHYRPLGVRIVTFVVGGIIAFIVLSLAFVLLGANQGNPIVEIVTAVADFFAWPFRNMFTLDSADLSALLNYGIAVLAYALIGVGINTLFRKTR